MRVHNLSEKAVYGFVSFESYVSELQSNLDLNAIGLIDLYDPSGFTLVSTAFKLQGQSLIKFNKSEVYNKSLKVVARLFNTEGIFWVDEFLLQDGVVNIDFTSQGASGGSGELKTFNGSLTQDGQPVSRAVYALGIDGDAPAMLASAMSDAQGNYSLSWHGYTGQILITATDDYGDLFSPATLLNIGARLHPAAPNGYVYEASSAGTLGIVEPEWPAVEGESVTSGEVQLTAKPFYRPKSAGPFTIA